MSLFDFFRRRNENKGGQRQSSADEASHKETSRNCGTNTGQLSAGELKEAVETLSGLSRVFRSSGSLVGGRNEKMGVTMLSYAGILGYLYEEEYRYGDFSGIAEGELLSHYRLVRIAMSDAAHRERTLKELADNWSDVLLTILLLRAEGAETGRKLDAMEPAISQVTVVFERLSGKKCRKPEDHSAVDGGEDEYAAMVRGASSNPFNITCDPRLQRALPFPDISGVMAGELQRAYSSLDPRRLTFRSASSIISGYFENMVSSYYRNAGCVPVNALNQIIEQVYKATQLTGFSTWVPSFDEFKRGCYVHILSR